MDGFGKQWEVIIEQLQAIIDELRSNAPQSEYTDSDIPDVYVPFLRTVLEACSAGDDTPEDELHAIHQMTMQVVDRIAEEVTINRSIWSSFKMADQENLRSEIFGTIFDKQLKGFTVAEAENLADLLLQQAKASDEKLRSA